jgi:hypothetical protein
MPVLTSREHGRLGRLSEYIHNNAIFLRLSIGNLQSASIINIYLTIIEMLSGRLCGLAVTVPGYGCRGPGFDSRRYQVF